MTDRPLYRRTLDGFAPFNDIAQEQCGRLKLGDVGELKLTKVRNGKFHRLFFAILKMVSENSNPHITTEQALYFAKVGAGCGQWVDTGQKELFAPGSISFANMDQAAFDAFVKQAIPPLVTRFMVGTAPDDLIAEAMAVAG